MATELDVVNAALIRLGEKTIVQLSPPQNKPARIAHATFAEHRDFVLSDHWWKFATERRKLAASATAPAYGALYAYPLPPEVLTVWEVEGQDTDDWTIERHLGTRAILTNLIAPLPIIASVQVVDLSTTSPEFRNALSLYCAYEWAEAITGTTALKQDLLGEYRLKISAARSMDGRQRSPRRSQVKNSWLDVR